MAAFLEKFTQFYDEYACTAYYALEAHKDMSQAQLKKQWWKRMQKVHPDKGGDTRSAQMANEAWDILKEPSSKERYDAFLQEFPDAQTWKQHTDTEAGVEGDGSPCSSPETPDLDPLEFLRFLGFSNVSPAEVDELKSKVDRIGERARWSYMGFWFKWTVPIVDTMHPIVFILFFMASDIAQTAVLLWVLENSIEPIGLFIMIPCLELLLTMGIGLRIYYKQVLEQCEYWNMEYVLGARTKYWVLRGISALILCIASFYKGSSATYYIIVLRLWLAASQYLAHQRARNGSWVHSAVGGPNEHIPELRTNLLLYYDSWLNSFLVCLMISLVGFFTVPFVLTFLILDVLRFLLRACPGNDDKKERDRDEEQNAGPCCALGFLVLILNATSWSAYKFANWRLKNMQQEFDKEDGMACDIACLKWIWGNFIWWLEGLKAFREWEKEDGKAFGIAHVKWILGNFDWWLEGLKRKRGQARAQRAKEESEKADRQKQHEEGKDEQGNDKHTDFATTVGKETQQTQSATPVKANETTTPVAVTSGMVQKTEAQLAWC